jgi:MFS family permease
VLAIALPLALVVRHRPEDHGMLPDGARSQASLADDPDAGDEEWGMSIGEVLRTPAFWFISFGQASALLVIGAFMVHLVVFIDEDLGFGLGLAAFAITIQTMGQVTGQGLGAYTGDRWPKRPLIVAALLGHASAIFLLALSTSSTLWLVYTAAAINGLAWGLRAPLQTAIRADYFGRKSFGLIMGFSSLVIMIGMIAGPTFAGIMYDQTGNYRVGFFVLSIFAALGSFLFVLARPPEARERWQAAAVERRRRPSPGIAGAGAERPRQPTPAGR